ncbi:MAG: GIY-YIG nuclease family protein [Candidatus Fermentibacteraceae bacterium]|nr:GIY-YIG nuclease family protein [Candidatus Fermentibacteraceae bacterium]
MLSPPSGNGGPLEERLNSLAVSVFDCQTTGASPGRGRLLELAWTVIHPPQLHRDAEVHSFMVALPPGETVPPRVSRITGITDEMLHGCIAPAELARLIMPVLQGTLPVAHFASFEERWIGYLIEGIPGEAVLPCFICTREIARRLYPGVPRKGIRALAGFMGFTMGEKRRAGLHVLATVRIWKNMLRDLEDIGITTVTQLEEFLSLPVPESEGGFRYPLPRDVRLSLPDSPGVYRFLSGDGAVLYAGKATSLRSRVNSYFTRRRGSERTLELVSQVHGLRVDVCETPLEAAMLEFRMIREYDPPYNVALRERGAGVSFLSPDLRQEMEGPGEGPAWGPVPSCSTALILGELLEALNSGGVVPASRLGLDYLPLSRGALEEGFERFRRRVTPVPGLTASELLATGKDFWLSGHEGESEDVSEGDAEGIGEPGKGMDGQGVADHLSWVLASGARDLRRGAWFCLLGWSVILWRPAAGGGERVVSLEAGGMKEARWRHGEPVPAAARLTRTERQGLISGGVYDMLRVLDSEVRRVTADGSLEAVHVPGGGCLDLERMNSLYLSI